MEFVIDSEIGILPEIQLVFYSDLQDSEKSLSTILNKYRDCIDNIKPLEWKINRKKINEYDFDVNPNIINRAFYKLYEIIEKYDIWKDLVSPDILHVAEAPGGFIQCSLFKDKKPIVKTKLIVDNDGFTNVPKKNKKTQKKANIHTISLSSNTVSNYSKQILVNNVTVIKGVDNTGDICNLKNVDFIYYTYHIKYHYITADGGFDEGQKFNSKEELHYKLICSEIYTALTLNKLSGHFILKVFDLHTNSSIHLMYLLSLCYKQIFIYKPLTSRPTNSEKYIVCKDFIGAKQEYITVLQNICNDNSGNRFFTIFKEIPHKFLIHINDINKEFLNQQTKNLQIYIDICKSNKKIIEKNKQVTFSKWCQQFNFNQ
jgi:23S rRNA U2552 (ribose-2'-O)-methylase RlmE/FtsJ